MREGLSEGQRGGAKVVALPVEVDLCQGCGKPVAELLTAIPPSRSPTSVTNSQPAREFVWGLCPRCQEHPEAGSA